jgi:hypothetical protein
MFYRSVALKLLKYGVILMKDTRLEITIILLAWTAKKKLLSWMAERTEQSLSSIQKIELEIIQLGLVF